MALPVFSTKTMNHNDFAAACPETDFTVPCKPFTPYFSVGDYAVKHLQKIFNIIKSSPNLDNSIIVDFVTAGIKDHHLPFTSTFLTENLQCSSAVIGDVLRAQSSHFAISFEPMEYKALNLLHFVPFVLDPETKLRKGSYGRVEKVFEGNEPFARKTISDNYDSDTIFMEIKVLKLATETRNPHLLHLRCAYEQENRTYIIMHPWCDLDLSTFLQRAHMIPWWNEREPEERLILMTDWMACLASGLSALHKQNIKHQDMKPENVLLDANLSPVICDFGLSKVFEKYSKSVKVQGTLAYMPPERFTGAVGRKGDVFSLALVFLELGLFFFGQKKFEK
jgi:serine/threonine protein kinase